MRAMESVEAIKIAAEMEYHTAFRLAWEAGVPKKIAILYATDYSTKWHEDQLKALEGEG